MKSGSEKVVGEFSTLFPQTDRAVYGELIVEVTLKQNNPRLCAHSLDNQIYRISSLLMK